MIKNTVSLSCLLCFLFVPLFPQYSLGIEVSGYSDKGIYVYGDLDVDSSGSVDGYLYTDKGKAIHVEGEIQDKSTVEIDSDSWGGGEYELDIDSW